MASIQEGTGEGPDNLRTYEDRLVELENEKTTVGTAGKLADLCREILQEGRKLIAAARPDSLLGRIQAADEPYLDDDDFSRGHRVASRENAERIAELEAALEAARSLAGPREPAGNEERRLARLELQRGNLESLERNLRSLADHARAIRREVERELGEVEELVGSLDGDGDPWKEAGDVGNFAAMIADRVTPKERTDGRA